MWDEIPDERVRQSVLKAIKVHQGNATKAQQEAAELRRNVEALNEPAQAWEYYSQQDWFRDAFNRAQNPQQQTPHQQTQQSFEKLDELGVQDEINKLVSSTVQQAVKQALEQQLSPAMKEINGFRQQFINNSVTSQVAEINEMASKQDLPQFETVALQVKRALEAHPTMDVKQAYSLVISQQLPEIIKRQAEKQGPARPDLLPPPPSRAGLLQGDKKFLGPNGTMNAVNVARQEMAEQGVDLRGLGGF